MHISDIHTPQLNETSISCLTMLAHMHAYTCTYENAHVGIHRYRKALIKMIDEHTTFLQYDNLDCHIPLIKKTIAGVAEGSDANTDKDKDTKARRDRGDNDNDDEDRNSDDNNDEDDINFHINALLSCWENEKAKRDVEAAIHAGRKRTTEAAETMEKKVRNSRSRTSNSHNYSSDASDIEGGKQAEDAGEYLRMYRGMIKFLEYDRWHLVKAQTRPSSSSSSTPSSPSPSFISRSRLKKESARAARRILIRNSGFTQLLECLYPHSVRLSIHLHDNGGPKFAVRLLPRDNAAGRTGDGRVCGGDGQIPVANHATAALELLASPSPSSSSSYLPATPWHNVLVKMMDGRMLFVHKRKILDAQSVFLCSNRTLHACQHVFELVHRNGQPWCYQQRIKE